MSGPNKGEPEALVAFEPLPRLIPCKTTISTRMERTLVQLRRAYEAVAAYAQALPAWTALIFQPLSSWETCSIGTHDLSLVQNDSV
jgi:hypothetical protein